MITIFVGKPGMKAAGDAFKETIEKLTRDYGIVVTHISTEHLTFETRNCFIRFTSNYYLDKYRDYKVNVVFGCPPAFEQRVTKDHRLKRDPDKTIFDYIVEEEKKHESL